MKKLLVVKKINALQTFSLISKYLLFLVLLCLTNSCKKEILTDSKQSLLASAKVASVGIQSQQCDQWTYLGSVEVVCPCEGHHVGDASCRCHTQAYMEYYFSLSSCSPPSGGGSVTVVSSEIYPNNGGGGGGGVVPYPTGPNLLPLDYNPDCENQRRAMLLPPPGDDGCAILPNRPLINRINNLAIHLDLSLNELEWLYRNETLVGEIERSMENYYVDDDFRVAVHFALQLDRYGCCITEAMITGVLNVTLPLSMRSQIPVIKQYIKLQAAIERQNDPTISNFIAYYRATQEFIHLGLDIAGLAPIVGEVFDLTNGVLYALEGDWSNASISVVSTVPFWGTIPATARIVKKGTKVLMLKTSNGFWTWTRNSYAFRKALGLIPHDGLIAHHIIPLGEETHKLIQRAAENGFDMNNALKNGMPLTSAQHRGAHAMYSQRIRAEMEEVWRNLGSNPTPEQARSALEALADRIRNIINSNPNVDINTLTLSL